MYRPGEVKSRPLGYSRMQWFFFPSRFFLGGGGGRKKTLNSSISQRTTLAGCQKTWQNPETSDSVTLLDNWSPALPVKAGKLPLFTKVPIKLSSQRCTLANTTFSDSLLCMPHRSLSRNVNWTGSVFLLFWWQISVNQFLRKCEYRRVRWRLVIWNLSFLCFSVCVCVNESNTVPLFYFKE